MQVTFISIFFTFLFGLAIVPKIQATTPLQLSKKYYVLSEQRTYVSAIIGCKTAGLQLATIESAEEQSAAVNATKEAEYTSSNGYWIGGAAEATYSTDWHWLETGLKMVYTNWGTNQPRYNDYDNESGNCVRMGNFYKVNETYTWENINCNSALYYICQELV